MEIWDIARYVEDHPEDFDKRWRLAKKLYMAWEYRLALEHLLILKQEWQERVNVVRYLAATYYRLGRYDEATNELTQAIQKWPQEIGLHEQLARVHEIAGERAMAANAWETIQRLDPHHPIARSAVNRLRAKQDDTPISNLKLGESDSGIDLSPANVCPNCGAQNSDEFDRCWQCHAPLEAGEDMLVPEPDEEEQANLPMETLVLVGGIFSLVLLFVDIFIAIQLLWFNQPSANYVPMSIWDVYTYEISATRVITGALLLFWWPIAFWLSAFITRIHTKTPPVLINLTGVLLATISFVASFLPENVIIIAPLLPLLIAFIIIIGTFRLNFIRSFTFWTLQMVVVIALLVPTVVILERIQTGTFYNPLTEFPALIQYLQNPEDHADTQGIMLMQNTIPIQQNIRWESTGSAWLDRRGGRVRIDLSLPAAIPMLRLEVKGAEDKSKISEEVAGMEFSRSLVPVTEEQYTLSIQAPAGLNLSSRTVRTQISSLLRPVVE